MIVEPPLVKSVSTPPELNLDANDPHVVSLLGGKILLARFELTSGKSQGVELIVIDADSCQLAICPTRGMNLWRACLDGIECRWNSPVKGPIHPCYVPDADASGIGWLEGFDELVARCGLKSFGAPDFDDSGRLVYGLHGRISNLPASSVRFEIDEATQQLDIVGSVSETRFLIHNLELEARFRIQPGQPIVAIADKVHNRSAQPTSIQMLYHVNLGSPLLQSGTRLELPADQVVARDPVAQVALTDWATYDPPTSGFSEQVYFSKPISDSEGWASTLLNSPESQQAFALRFQTSTLPYFTQWKNTAANEDGYVTGLEPGTGFPNPRSFEEKHNRVVHLEGGQSCSFELELEGISDSARIEQVRSQVGARNPELLESREDWCNT